jgi:hypothetical protein
VNLNRVAVDHTGATDDRVGGKRMTDEG